MIRILFITILSLQSFFAYSQTVSFVLNKKAVPNEGAAYTIQMMVGGFTNVVTTQFSLNWDANLVEFQSVSNFGLAGIDLASFNTLQASNGILSFSWDDPDGTSKSLTNGAVIFEMNFNRISPALAEITFANTPTPLEVGVINGNGDLVSGTTANSSVCFCD